MARALAVLGGFAAGFVFATAIMVSHADPAEADVQAAAAEAHVDVADLVGAMASSGTDNAFAYLRGTGELPALHPPTLAAATHPPGGVWDRLAECESGGDWSSTSNPIYRGGLQFDLSTWRAYGGVGLPQNASRAEQIAVAERLRAARGFAPWPACSRRLGLR
jgi:hypothetical protein